MKLEIKDCWIPDGDHWGPGGIVYDDFPPDKSNFCIAFNFSVGAIGGEAAADFVVQVRTPNFPEEKIVRQNERLEIPYFAIDTILAVIEPTLRLAEKKGPGGWQAELDRFFFWEYRDYDDISAIEPGAY